MSGTFMGNNPDFHPRDINDRQYLFDSDYRRRRNIQDDQEDKIAAERAEYRKKQLGQGDFGGTKGTVG